MNFKNWASTPPMGWNSYDYYNTSVTEADVKRNADYMAKYLKPHKPRYPHTLQQTKPPRPPCKHLSPHVGDRCREDHQRAPSHTLRSGLSAPHLCARMLMATNLLRPNTPHSRQNLHHSQWLWRRGATTPSATLLQWRSGVESSG